MPHFKPTIRELKLAHAAFDILWWFEGQDLDLDGQLTGERSSLDAVREALKPYVSMLPPMPERNVQRE